MVSNTMIVTELASKLTLNVEELNKCMNAMMEDMKKGLASNGETLAMIPSYVVNRPKGDEIGVFLALDLGGTNFRVCLISLEGKGKIELKFSKFTVSNELKNGSGEELFDFFAHSVANFLTDHGLDVQSHIPLGFTFSFPVNQTAIDKGTLVKWTKGFTAPGVEGEDVVALLQKAFNRNGVKVIIKAVVNDTVGTLMSHAYSQPDTQIGVILGTGTNAAYVEKAVNVPKWPSDVGEVIINSEWGNFGEKGGLPMTEYDVALDESTSNPGKQRFEKMISGMYLGELTRFVFLDLVNKGQLFKNGADFLKNPNSFVTADLSLIESDESADLKSVNEFFVKNGVSPSSEDLKLVKNVCQLIGTRAARLSAVGVAALATKISSPGKLVVAIDGSVFEHYPHFGERMRDALKEMMGEKADNIILEKATDGSGQGAALIAALA